jgi:hypothetical protein
MTIAEQRKEEGLAFIQRGEELIKRGREILTEVNIIEREEGGLTFAKIITGYSVNTIRKYVNDGKIRTASKPGTKFWFTKEMLMEDEKLGFPDYEKRAELELKGITL